MARLGICLAILTLLIIYIDFNKSQPVYIPSKVFQQLWSKDWDIQNENPVCRMLNMINPNDEIWISF